MDVLAEFVHANGLSETVEVCVGIVAGSYFVEFSFFETLAAGDIGQELQFCLFSDKWGYWGRLMDADNL